MQSPYDGAPIWWSPDTSVDKDEDQHKRAEALRLETQAIEQRQSAWHDLNLWNSTLYTNRELIGFRWGESNADRELWPTNLRTENIVEEIGEAMLSKASSAPLKPGLVPRGNSYKTERAVRLLDTFLFCLWRQIHAEDACVQMFRDAFMAGIGCVKVTYDTKKKTVGCEPVFFDNLVIDNRECANRQQPRTYRIRQILPKVAVEAKYGDIDNATAPYQTLHRQTAADWVALVEAWHLPDSDGKGGRHSIACNGRMLVDEEWNDDWIPLIFFHWQDRTSGFFVKSGVEQVVPFQVRQNELNDAIELSQDIRCRPRILLNANTNIDINQWDNEAGRFLLWTGTEPKPFAWPTELGELYQERERNKAAAFSHMGVSEMYANADLPQGARMDSSAAVREVRNMEDSRHLRLWTNFEQARLRVAKTILLVLAKEKGAEVFTTAYHPRASKKGAKRIEWEAVKTLTADHYSWTLEATPMSATSPAAQREIVRDWTSRGIWSPELAAEAARNVNLSRDEALETAADDDIYRHIGIMEDGGYERPTKYTAINNGLKKVAANMHRLMDYEDVEDSVIAAHQQWLVTASTIQQQVVSASMQMQQQPMTPFAPTQGMAGTSSAVAQ